MVRVAAVGFPRLRISPHVKLIITLPIALSLSLSLSRQDKYLPATNTNILLTCVGAVCINRTLFDPPSECSNPSGIADPAFKPDYSCELKTRSNSNTSTLRPRQNHPSNKATIYLITYYSKVSKAKDKLVSWFLMKGSGSKRARR